MPAARARLVVLISGRGSNLRAIVEASRRPGWPGEVVGVVADRPTAGGIALARGFGLPVDVVDFRAFGGDRAAFDAALAAAVDALGAEVVVLAGFMRVLGDAFVERWGGRLVNIHPSLLPAFAGLHTHRRALEAGCAFAGATVHLVIPALDAGPILGQVAVPVRDGDDESTLAARVLDAEHRLYPRVLADWLAGRIVVDAAGRSRRTDGAPRGVFDAGEAA